MASTNVLIIDDSNFDSEVMNSSTPVLVDFTATWCGPCKMISPVYDELSAEYDGKAVLIKVDVDEAADIAQDCGISAMPTFQFYKHSERVSEFAGADPNRLKATIADLV